ncbi:MAG: DUF2237 domain-containing protein [Betaproteobacteria bacterium]
MNDAKNVFGEPLAPCCLDPLTGFYRTGACDTGPEDRGAHVVCARVTQAFLEFERAQGNDLVTAVPEHDFPGLKAGDQWCLCAGRWREALEAGVAPPVVLAATHEKVLDLVPLEALKRHALDLV